MTKYIMTVVLVAALTGACGGGTEAPPTAAPTPPASFQQIDLAPGTGAQAGPGARVTVKYTGWVYDPSKPDNKGYKFDSTDTHEPLTFNVGKGEVIPGWDQGFTGLKVGGRRRLIIPPNLAYGAEGVPDAHIPPNAGLVFDMELVDVK